MFSSRSLIITRAPAPTRRLAMALPIPRPAPVTAAVFPSRVNGIPGTISPSVSVLLRSISLLLKPAYSLHCSILNAAVHKREDVRSRNFVALVTRAGTLLGIRGTRVRWQSARTSTRRFPGRALSTRAHVRRLVVIQFVDEGRLFEMNAGPAGLFTGGSASFCRR